MYAEENYWKDSSRLSVAMVFFRNYRFYFLLEGHKQQCYTWKKRFDSIFRQLIFLRQIPDFPKNRGLFLIIIVIQFRKSL